MSSLTLYAGPRATENTRHLLVHIVYMVALLYLTAAPYVAAQDPLRSKFGERLKSLVEASDAIVGIAIKDLNSGDEFVINGDEIFPQASSIKIHILTELYRQAEAGKFRLSDVRSLPEPAKVGGSGVLAELGQNSVSMSIRDYAVLMIVLSDNTATNLLLERVGRDNVNQTLASLGFTTTRLQRKMMDDAARGRGEENLSTPAEAARLMELLFKCDISNRAACDDLLAILKIPKRGDLRAGLPPEVPIAFKPGGIPGVTTEWAIVYLKERPYVVVVMENYGLEADAGAAMKEISRALYDYFWRRGRATRYGTYVDPALIH